MNHPPEPAAEAIAAGDAFARRIAARLTEGSDELPYDIGERLRAARMQALARRKRAVAPVLRPATAGTVLHAGGTAVLGGHHGGGDPAGWWRAALSAVPLVALLFGLVFINASQDESLASEIAEVDAAMLADDLPPSAYADPGFVQYLRVSGSTP
ncbi:DUF3619 domain-containing protein [Melaminivora suipulveris]|uniref:DUF3619 domain-containing protein n=1 Tax=Melaminivora suipulveris TaxID=2109913 RepID=A0A2R3Q8F0_9BURK|nr:DUF3619 family protein [Melaminivora suipulveris]AVO48053.1 DUF3619 domain-containing protein [Melaminivora suipulveris]